jgi:hypothetical protein
MSTFNTLAARRLEIARHTSMGVSRMPKGDYRDFLPGNWLRGHANHCNRSQLRIRALAGHTAPC